MKKYIAPALSIIELKEESNLMLTASNRETTNDSYFSNKRDEEKPAGSSIWDN